MCGYNTPILESTMPELLANIQRGFPETEKRQNATDEVNLTDMDFVQADGALIVKGVVRGSGGKQYQPVIEFQGVEYVDGEPADSNVATFKTGDGASHTIKLINSASTDVRVTCTCLDFRFRFAHYNQNNQSLFGSPPPAYATKGMRAPANPRKVPGVCKHVIELMSAIEGTGVTV